MGSFIAWLGGLSAAGRVGLVAGSFFTLGAVGNIIAPVEERPTTTETRQIEVAQHETIEPVSLVETKIEKETEAIPFATTSENDPSINEGESIVSQAGVNGTRTTTYEVVYTDGKETRRKQVSETITKQPVTKIVLIGTYVPPVAAPTPAPSPGCDPNYSGGCVPIASDVDCAGGSGNGPAYVAGPVYVIGSDIYGLDRDNDGVGCE